MSRSEGNHPLGVRNELSLSIEELEMLRRIEAHDLWFVEERLIRKGRVSAENVEEAVFEFKRYMALVGLGYRGLAMLRPDVDEVWHAFILFTREYSAFCQEAFGTFVHHVPRTSRSPAPAGAEAFLAGYDDVFGAGAAAAYSTDRLRIAGDEPSGCGTEDCTSD